MPVIQIGPLALPVYPLALILGGWLGLEVSARAARRLGLDGDHIYNAAFAALIAGVVVGRLTHVIVYWSAYRSQPLEIIGLNTRAFLPVPALIAAIAAWCWYVYRHKLPWLIMLDALAPGLLVAVGIIDVGAFVAGRNLGAPSDLPWAVMQFEVSRHPAQLYEAAAAFGGAAFVWWIIAQARPSGVAALVALAWYGLSRWLLEPFHADSLTMLGGLRTAQVVGFVVALVALWLLARRARTSDAPGIEASAGEVHDT